MLSNKNETLKVLVCKQLLKTYTIYKNVFSKTDFKVWLLHRSDVNHKIILKKDNDLLSSSLYSMSLK